MKKLIFIFSLILLGLSLNSFAAMTVAEARAQGNYIPVEVGPVYISTTNDLGGGGYSIFAQDNTGGIQLYGPSYIMPDFIVSNNLVPGSCVVLSGTNNFYQNAYEISYVAVVNNYGVSNVPTATPIDIDTLATPAPAPALEPIEGKLIVISGIDFADSGVFASGNNYTIWKNGTQGVVRIQDANDHLVGTAIPFGNEVVITGIFSVYGTSYQILPLEIVGPTRDPYLWLEPYPSINFGVVYPGYSRTLNLNIRNGGESNDLNVTGFSVLAGDTANFSPNTIADFTLAPKQETNFSFTYTPGSVGDVTNWITYSFNTSDPSNATVNFSMFGKSSSNAPPTPAVWINEVGYNDPGADDEEFIELCGVAGTAITGWKIQLVNGNDGSNYYEWVIGSEAGSFTFQDEQDGYGFYVLASSSSPSVPNTDETMASDMQNGDDDAVRLIKDDGTEIHFFAYNSKSAINYEYGLPNDLTPLYDLTYGSNTLQKAGTGTEEPDFSWEQAEWTPGVINRNQVLPEPLGIGILIIGLAALLKTRK